MKSLVKNTIFNTIYNIANILFPLITSMYISRILLSDGVGQVSYGQNIASYFVTFAALGLPTYGVREIAKVRTDKTKTNRLFTELFCINLLSTLVSTVAFLILIFSVARFKEELGLFLCCGVQIVMNVLNIDWFYQGNEEYGYIALRSITVKVISLLCVIFLVRTRQDYIVYALISSLAVSANYIFNIIHVRKYVSFDFKGLDFKKHFQPLLILAISLFLSSVYSKVDITMLGSMATNKAIGLYSNSHKIVDMLVVASTSISAVFLPRLSYYYNNDKEEFHRLVDVGAQILSLLTFPLTMGVFVLAPHVIEVMYGTDFLPATGVLRIFTLLIIIKGFGNLLCYQLVIATGNEKKRLPAYLAAAILNIVLNYLLIPILYEKGAAIASVISEIAVNVIQLIAMIKILELKINYKNCLKSLMCTFVMGGGVMLSTMMFEKSLLVCIVGFLVGVVLYFVFNYNLKNEMFIDILKKVKKH